MALTEQKKSGYNTTITNCDDAYLEGSMSRYVFSGRITSNCPNTNNVFLVESISSDNTLSGNFYGFQIATKIGSGVIGERYIRYRNSSNKTWSNWQQFTTVEISSTNDNQVSI